MRINDPRRAELESAETRRRRFGTSPVEVMRIGETEPSHFPILLQPGEAFRLPTETSPDDVREWRQTTEAIRPFVVDAQGRETLGPPLSFAEFLD